MRDIVNAIAEEKKYVSDRMQEIDTSLRSRLLQYGYDNLDEYFSEKIEYLFNEWKPDVHYIDADFLSNGMEEAIANKEYGIYILAPEKLYAFHGNDDIDYDMCEELGVRVIELHYQGGTIVGSSEDLGILLVIPNYLQLSSNWIIEHFFNIISKYVDGAEILGNDILVNGEKVMGSMNRTVGDSFVWAAQISFGEYDDLITKICNKKSSKEPGKIDSSKMTRDNLESEVLAWLQKL